MSTDHVDINFEVTKDLSDKKKSIIKAYYANKTNDMVKEIAVRVAQAKHLRMNLHPLNKDSIEPKNERGTYQTIELENTLLGQKGVALKMKISYKINGMEHTKDGIVSNFPSDY